MTSCCIGQFNTPIVGSHHTLQWFHVFLLHVIAKFIKTLWLFSLFFLSVLASLAPRHNVVAGILKNVIPVKVVILFFKTLLLLLFPTLSRYLMGTPQVSQVSDGYTMGVADFLGWGGPGVPLRDLGLHSDPSP